VSCVGRSSIVEFSPYLKNCKINIFGIGYVLIFYNLIPFQKGIIIAV